MIYYWSLHDKTLSIKDLKINFANVELNYMEENYSKPILFEPQDKKIIEDALMVI